MVVKIDNRVCLNCFQITPKNSLDAAKIEPKIIRLRNEYARCLALSFWLSQKASARSRIGDDLILDTDVYRQVRIIQDTHITRRTTQSIASYHVYALFRVSRSTVRHYYLCDLIFEVWMDLAKHRNVASAQR